MDEEMQRQLIDWEIDQRFSFHPATDETRAQHERARFILRGAAIQINKVIPAGREAAVVMTKLEEALMWANKAIAMQDPVV